MLDAVPYKPAESVDVLHKKMRRRDFLVGGFFTVLAVSNILNWKDQIDARDPLKVDALDINEKATLSDSTKRVPSEAVVKNYIQGVLSQAKQETKQRVYTAEEILNKEMKYYKGANVQQVLDILDSELFSLNEKFATLASPQQITLISSDDSIRVNGYDLKVNFSSVYSRIEQLKNRLDSMSASNLGAGAHVYKQKNGDSIELRTIISSDNSIQVTQNDNEIDITAAASGATLNGLSDVVITAPQSNQFLRYDSGLNQWTNQTVPNASVLQGGLLAAADYALFQSKENPLSFGIGLQRTGNLVVSTGVLSLTAGSGLALSGSAQAPVVTITNVGTPGTYGSSTQIPIITTDNHGRVTNITTTSVTSAPVASVFGRTGAVVAQNGDYTTSQVTEGVNLYYTDTRSRNAISVAGSPLTYVSSTGVLGINQANASQAGYLSAADWNTFNTKQSALSLGNVTTTTPGLSVLNGTGSVIGTGTSIDYNLVTGISSLATGSQGVLGGTGDENSYIGADGQKHLLPTLSGVLSNANNGLSISGTSTVQLGGPLTQSTTIQQNGFDFLWTSTNGVNHHTGTYTVSGVDANRWQGTATTPVFSEGNFEAFVNTTGNVTNVRALNATLLGSAANTGSGTFYGFSSSANTNGGTANAVYGVETTGTAKGTVNSAYGIQANANADGGTAGTLYAVNGETNILTNGTYASLIGGRFRVVSSLPSVTGVTRGVALNAVEPNFTGISNFANLLIGQSGSTAFSGSWSVLNTSSQNNAFAGNTKFGNIAAPTTTVHITSSAANTSGLRLENLTSSSPPTTGQPIGVDATGNVVTVASSGGITGANNGLTLTGSNVQLGGNLVQSTTISLNSFDLLINGQGKFNLTQSSAPTSGFAQNVWNTTTTGSGYYAGIRPTTVINTVGSVVGGCAMDINLNIGSSVTGTGFFDATRSQVTGGPSSVGDRISGLTAGVNGAGTFNLVAAAYIEAGQSGGTRTSVVGVDAQTNITSGTATNIAVGVFRYQGSGPTTSNRVVTINAQQPTYPTPHQANLLIGQPYTTAFTGIWSILNSSNRDNAHAGKTHFGATTSPHSTIQSSGSIAGAVRVSNSATESLTDTDYTLITTGSAPVSLTLPAPSSCTGRIYKIVNHNSVGSITLSLSVITSGTSSSSTIPITEGSNAWVVISDGTSWRRVSA